MCVGLCVFQISTLINHKDKLKKSEKTLRALHRLGQAVGIAVGRFVTVGEAIATEHLELKEEMILSCSEARRAGKSTKLRPGPCSTNRTELAGELHKVKPGTALFTPVHIPDIRFHVWVLVQ